jgi:hypothetical protein
MILLSIAAAVLNALAAYAQYRAGHELAAILFTVAAVIWFVIVGIRLERSTR